MPRSLQERANVGLRYFELHPIYYGKAKWRAFLRDVLKPNEFRLLNQMPKEDSDHINKVKEMFGGIVVRAGEPD